MQKPAPTKEKTLAKLEFFFSHMSDWFFKKIMVKKN